MHIVHNFGRSYGCGKRFVTLLYRGMTTSFFRNTNVIGMSEKMYRLTSKRSGLSDHDFSFSAVFTHILHLGRKMARSSGHRTPVLNTG